MVKHWKLIFIAILLGLALPLPANTAPELNPGPDFFLNDPEVSFLCPERITRRTPYRCPAYSPGARVARMEYLRARLPNPLPQLPVEEIEVPEGAVTQYSFAIVRPLPVNTYAHPAEAEAGLPPKRQFLSGDNWVSVMGQVDYNGQSWYEINSGEFISAANLAFVSPSRFHGIVLSEQPEYAFAWINRYVSPSETPGGPPMENVVLNRYERITIFAQELLGDEMWYMIGPDQWVEQSFTSRADVDPRPEGVGPGEKWIEVNTYEQTLAAYEGERMVFATLVSTGRSSTWTPDGLTRIWSKLPATPMINRETTNDSPAWYYLEHVEWTQYFNGAYALHTAYWHDAFGFTRSHGCVNLAPLDAKWLFDWTTPYVPEGAAVAYSDDAGGVNTGTWVWVHMTAPIPGYERSQ